VYIVIFPVLWTICVANVVIGKEYFLNFQANTPMIQNECEMEEQELSFFAAPLLKDISYGSKKRS